jgi:hypothetical protein
LTKVSDPRLNHAWARCPDDNHVLVPTGDMSTTDGTNWSIHFCCPEHPDEIIRLWRPELQPLIEEILADQ